jgi:hypothetical protein
MIHVRSLTDSGARPGRVVWKAGATAERWHWGGRRFAAPSSAEYWHIGAITTRLRKVSERSVSEENSATRERDGITDYCGLVNGKNSDGGYPIRKADP